MTEDREIGIGIVGAGFLAETRARCYARVAGLPSRVVAVADTDEQRAVAYARRYSIPAYLTDFKELLELPGVDMVDLCVPNHLHRPMTEAAAAAGKHVVCTKPLTAYVGQDLPAGASDEEISARDRRAMLRLAADDAQAMVEATDNAGVLLMYGENWIYAPSLVRATDLMLASKGTILEMRGGECHSGSHSPFSKIWRYTGGGALIRLGAHPIGSMIYLKHQEGINRDGVPIRPVSIAAEVGDLTKIPSLVAEKEEWVARGWQDVENWGSAILTFDDGSRGIVWASDAVLGGMESRLEIYMSNALFKCNLSPNNMLNAFSPDAAVFGEEYLMEKVETKAGWNTPMPDEDWTSGHLAMCQAFVEAVSKGEPAKTDGRLGLEVVKAVYSAYISAVEGCRVEL
jgi:predicted dehydrogenase